MNNFKTALKISTLTFAIALGGTACNDNYSSYPNAGAVSSSTPQNCSVSNSGGTATITCPDGSSATLSNGTQGVGSGIVASVIPANDPRCMQGNGGVEYTTFIDANDTGALASNDTVTSVNYICNGATGATGATGAAGSSSMISLAAADSLQCADGGWMVTVTNGSLNPSSYPVCNGATGASAPVSPLALTQLIAPCGLASSAWKEELMLFSDGTLLADFSSDSAGDDTRLSLIPDGTYEDTDESGCVFTISTSGSTRSISWNAGSSSAEPNGWSAGGQSWTVSN